MSRINDGGCSWERGRLRPVPDMMNPESDNLKPARSDLHTEMEKPSQRNYLHSETKFTVISHPVVTARFSGCGAYT